MVHLTKAFIIIAMLLIGNPYSSHAERKHRNRHARAREIVARRYPDQLTDPQKKNRRTFAQFGYNLYQFQVPIFAVTKFIVPGKFGYQSYGQPHRRTEKNGALYTCRGGFIDVSHVRTAIDWTVFLTFTLLQDTASMELPWEAGTLQLTFRNTASLPVEDIAAMAQKIAFERLTWHEIASWHYHKPYHKLTEQHSTFTPEDNYSNLLGTVIGRRVALRMIRDTTLSYSLVASDEIDKMIDTLQPMHTIKQSKRAYDIVDLNKQRKLDQDSRNCDVWYDSRTVFHDQRYIFKRDMNTGPTMPPWLVPRAEQVGCPTSADSAVLHVPQATSTGKSFYHYYTFTITPSTEMFYDRKKRKKLHPPFGVFTTQEMDKIVAHIRPQMEQILGKGFDKRDCKDPTPFYKGIKKVFFK